MYKAKNSITGEVRVFKTLRARTKWQDKCDQAYGRYICFPVYDEETREFILKRQGLISK